MVDPSLPALKSVLHRLLLAVSGLPTAQLSNLAEWDKAVPPIVEAAEAASMALRERNPDVASILLEVAAKCAAMREVIKGEDEGEHPPIPAIIRHREVQVAEIQAAIARALRELEE